MAAPKSSFKVVVKDVSSPPPRLYEVTLELSQVWVRQSISIDAKGVAEAEFSITGPGFGRVTIEKPSVLEVGRLPAARVQNIVLEDAYEYNLVVAGAAPAFRVAPVGFSLETAQTFDEAQMTFEPAADGGVRSVLRIEVPAMREFNAPERPRPAARTPATEEAPTRPAGVEPFRPLAHFFPGPDDSQRALIIAGVHGSEPEGVRTAEIVLDSLRGGNQPAHPTVVVTAIVPRTQPRGQVHVGKNEDRFIGIGKIDPNRNFPLPGTSYATARERGRQNGGVELVYLARQGTATPQLRPSISTKMLPETRLLLALIERFKPHRIASVHSHSLQRQRGNAPGIFVDPRGGVTEPLTKAPTTAQAPDLVADPETHQVVKEPALGKPDIELVKRMVCGFEQRVFDQRLRTGMDPLVGNKVSRAGKTLTRSISGISTIYSALHSPGNSLGMWAPEAVQETVVGVASPRGNRAPGISTVTVELPRGQAQTIALTTALERIHADVLLEVFLGASPLPSAPLAAPGMAPARNAKKGDGKKEFVPDVISDCPKA